ncbi:MAG: LabA-like NYN domain-containing protein [Planctomycetota bacterium]|jgi:uncharacterized LabA/DUF88 family protein/cold shock CspA family protein
MNLKAGVYVDGENVMRSGGWGMRYDILKEFVEAQGGAVLRANAYLAVDAEREKEDPEYSRAKSDYRSNLRRYGFKLILKPVQRYRDRDGEVITKANTDLELAIDSLLQARNLDYVVLVTGDGDFVRLVTALQNMGCRVDVISFFNTSGKLREAADNFISGFLLPGLLPSENGRQRGYLHRVDEEKYFGFITEQKSLKLHDTDQDIFCHGREVEAGVLGNRDFARLRGNRTILEFQTATDDKGRHRAVNVSVMKPSTEDRTRRGGTEEESSAAPPAKAEPGEGGSGGDAPEREEDGNREGE